MSNRKNPTNATENISNLINESQILKDFSKSKKFQQQRANKNKKEDLLEILCENNPDILESSLVKKRKTESCMENLDEPCEESSEKLLDILKRQGEARRLCDDYFLKSLTEIITQMEDENNTMQENKQMLEELTAAMFKYIQQSTTTLQQKLKTLKEIHASFKKECEETDKENIIKIDNFNNELGKYRQNIMSEIKLSGMEILQQTISKAIEKDN